MRSTSTEALRAAVWLLRPLPARLATSRSGATNPFILRQPQLNRQARYTLLADVQGAGLFLALLRFWPANQSLMLLLLLLLLLDGLSGGCIGRTGAAGTLAFFRSEPAAVHLSSWLSLVLSFSQYLAASCQVANRFAAPIFSARARLAFEGLGAGAPLQAISKHAFCFCFYFCMHFVQIATAGNAHHKNAALDQHVAIAALPLLPWQACISKLRVCRWDVCVLIC